MPDLVTEGVSAVSSVAGMFADFEEKSIYVMDSSHWAFRKGALKAQGLYVTKNSNAIIEKTGSVKVEMLSVLENSTMIITGVDELVINRLVVTGAKLTVQNCKSVKIGFGGVSNSGFLSFSKITEMVIDKNLVCLKAQFQASSIGGGSCVAFLTVKNGKATLDKVCMDCSKSFIFDKGDSTIAVVDCTSSGGVSYDSSSRASVIASGWGERGIVIGDGSTFHGQQIYNVKCLDTFITGKNADSLNLKDCNDIMAPTFAGFNGGQNTLDGVRNVTAPLCFLASSAGTNTVHNVGGITTLQFIEDTNSRTTCTSVGSVSGIGGILNLYGGLSSSIDWKGTAQGGSMTFTDTCVSLGNYTLTGPLFITNSSVEIGNFIGAAVEILMSSTVRIYGGVCGQVLVNMSTLELHGVICASIQMNMAHLKTTRVATTVQAVLSHIEMCGGTQNITASLCSIILNSVTAGTAQLTDCSYVGNSSNVQINGVMEGVVLNNCNASCQLAMGGIFANGGNGILAVGEGGLVTNATKGALTVGEGGIISSAGKGANTASAGGVINLGGIGASTVAAGGVISCGSAGASTATAGGVLSCGSVGATTCASGGVIALGGIIPACPCFIYAMPSGMLMERGLLIMKN